MPAQHHIEALITMLGPKGATTDPTDIAPHIKEWRGKYFGQTSLMVMPDSTVEAAQVVRYCNEHKIALVPQGGNTGVVGGSLPGLNGRDEVLISTKRMNSNIRVDAADYSVTVDAGCTVAAIQDAAKAANRLFPLSLASEGSCTAGGVVSTNAGGVHVVRYGTTRALTIGIEAILPDGEIYDSLSSLRKNNTGYALDQLFIGAEGTLGLVTKVAFRLFPPELERRTYWLAVDSPSDALELLASARTETADRVSVFEILPHAGLELVLTHIPGTINPLSKPYPWYILMEVATSSPDSGLRTKLEEWVASNMENHLIQDGAEAQSETQAKAFWKLRESMSEAQKHGGGSIKHDIAVPVSHVPAFITEATQTLEAAYPGCRVTPFGHLGDGNLHFNVLQPENANKEEFLAHWDSMNRLVHDIVTSHKGSISAEHGIGTMKKEELARLKNPAALTTMRCIKKALDPNNIMNPGVLFL
ncbi:FAD-binding oxidoreductase [Kordiimonas pumila]|uniref:FAD-binding oxidoreductase n=1 Tax=Kordiimonas pumila TaxID=2161677 RepID=A0ABV7D102_9PROT|nr:FAD-binding oxidoreductase [Kordiimonas pumila]